MIIINPRAPVVQKMVSATHRIIAIHQISIRETNGAIQGIVIYPVDRAIHLLNWRLMVISIKFLLVITKIDLPKMVTKNLMT